MSLPAHERYLFKPFPHSSHSWAQGQIRALPSVGKVLDIGPGSGAFGRILKEEFAIEEIDAVEIDAAAREHIAPWYDQVEEDLSAFEGRQYDLVLLLDVIEHMAEPEKYLAGLAPFLKPGATILISVPNISHWSVRFSLLFGKFDYQERGILDKTHLQFFTKKRVARLKASVDGASLAAYSVSLEPIEYFLPEWLWQSGVYQLFANLRHGLSSLLPGLLGFQHLAALKLPAPSND